MESWLPQPSALVPPAATYTVAHAVPNKYFGSSEFSRSEASRYFLLQKALRGARSRFREIADNSDYIVLNLDAQGNVSFCNEFLSNLIGWSKGEILGRNWCDACVPPDEYAPEVLASQMSEASIPLEYINHIITRYGTRRLIAWENRMLFDSWGAPTGVTSIGEDITEIARFADKHRLKPCAGSNNRNETVHAHDDDLELYIKGRLEPGRTSSVRAHLAQCDFCRKRLSKCIGLATATPRVKSDNRRAEPRFDTDEKVIIQEFSPLSLTRWSVTIVNVSKTGIGIESQDPLLPGTVVRLRRKNTFELAEVRYCIQCSNKLYRIGLQLQT